MKEVKINVPEGYEIDKDKSTFENIVFKKKDGLPKSWEDLRRIEGYWVGNVSEIIGMNYYANISIDNRNTFKTKEQAEASIALAQLSQLRDVYRQGWEPDWSDSKKPKYCIILDRNEVIVFVHNYCNMFLSFQERQTAELFLENFRDLIEQAKPLMG